MLAYVNFPRKQESIVLGLLYFFFILFVGTRLDTGCDFETYFHRFRQLTPEYASLSSITEPGYYLLTFAIKKLGMDFVWVNVIGASIFFYFLFKLSRNHPRPLLLITLTFSMLIVQLSMSGLRQALAVAFLMGALDAFMKGRRIHVAIYILIGSTFHQSVIILLPLAFMVGRSFSMARVLAAMVVLMPIAVYLLSDRMSVYQDRYLEQIYGEMNSGGAIFRLGILVLTALLFEIYSKKMARLHPNAYSLMRLFSLVSFALIPVLLINSVAAHRLIYYVVPMQAFTLAALPAAIFVRTKWIKLATMFPIGLYIAYILVWFSISRHAHICYIPYNSYLL